MPPSDDTAIEFEVSPSKDRREWDVRITCEEGLKTAEFAQSLIEFGQDILDGKIEIDSETVDKFFDPDRH